MATTAALALRPQATFQGSSSRTINGTVGTAVAYLIECFEPACEVLLKNEDATAGNTLFYFVGPAGTANAAPTTAAVAGPVGVTLPGANAFPTRIPMVRGDLLTVVAAADRVFSAIATPTY